MNKSRAINLFGDLLDVMDTLRDNCPWDKKQTFKSLRILTIEETYELADAIVSEDDDELKKEVGDLLLHIVFYCKLGSEKGSFDISDVIESLIEKLKYRHPHIYGDVKVADSDDVSKNWEALKQKEKGREKGVLSGVPNSLPPIVKAFRMQQKAKGVGFEWENREEVWDKVDEELREVKEEVLSGDIDRLEGELGDLLFAVVNGCRMYGIDPEIALERTNKKFKYRFNYIESAAFCQKRELDSLSLDEMEQLWNSAKKREE